MNEMRDITIPFTSRPEFQKELEQFRAKCLNFPGIKECQIRVSEFKGQRDGYTDNFNIACKGEIQVNGPLGLKLRLEAEGGGVLQPDERRIDITNVHVLNDNMGLMGKLLNWTGMARGRTVKLNQQDTQWLVRALC